MDTIQNELLLAAGTHPHKAKGKFTNVKNLKFNGEAALDGITFYVNQEATVEHEVPLKGNSQVRTPHAPVTLKQGLYTSITQEEYNPHAQKNQRMAD